MPENINLIPSEVVKERSLHNIFNRMIIVSVIVLFLVLGVSAYFFYAQRNSSQRVQELNSLISDKQEEVKRLEDVQRDGTELTARLDFIKNVLNGKVYYSRVMEELEERIIPGIVLNNINMTADFSVSISGTASNTTNFQNYVRQLVAEPDNLFSEARIEQLSIQENEGSANFQISVLANSELLYSILE